jgi:type IV secretion system protein VirD4
MRQFFGVRDHMTANVVSQMAGYETLEYDDEGRQAQAEHQMMQNIHAIMDGADPFENARAFDYHRQSSQRRSKIRRALIDPAEVMAMREDEAITFIAGKNLPPIHHNKFPYFERLKAGQFYPNSNHPPIDRIRVKSMFGHKTLSVRRVSVPAKYAHFPQYDCGYALQIEGQAM